MVDAATSRGQETARLAREKGKDGGTGQRRNAIAVPYWFVIDRQTADRAVKSRVTLIDCTPL